MAVLAPDELEHALGGVKGWSVESGQLTKTFEFKSYADGLLFVMAAGRVAEKQDHHPDMLVTWRKVKVSVSTHGEGGITAKDFGLAMACDALA